MPDGTVASTTARLVATWRSRADEFDGIAATFRRVGDTTAAQDAEQAALDYRVCADNLEAAGSVGEYRRRRDAAIRAAS